MKFRLNLSIIFLMAVSAKEETAEEGTGADIVDDNYDSSIKAIVAGAVSAIVVCLVLVCCLVYCICTYMHRQ